MKSSLSIPCYLTKAHIGCTADERANPQEVKFSVEIKFDELPLGCNTDSLDDTICYAELCKELERVATAKPYALVEHLAAEAFSALLPRLKKHMKLRLGLIKCNPPVPGISAGVEFVIKS